MKRFPRFALAILLAILPSEPARAAPAMNVVLVTADGLRWQEVFRGPDGRLLADEHFTPKDAPPVSGYQAVGPEQARAQLMPFFWSTLVPRGSVLGDRDHDSRMHVSNPWWFSYPGYNEILTGKADPAIDSNDKRWNANVTVLEWLNGQPAFKGHVRAFGSWDVFTYIINTQRSHLPVNDGFTTVTDRPNAREAWLNQLLVQLPRPWTTVRHDAITHNYAIESLRKNHPRVVYISYGETDDFAHDGEYAQYLDAAHRFDGFLREL